MNAGQPPSPQTAEPYPPWVRDAVFYHIYPLGFLGCPPVNPCIRNGEYRPDRTHTRALGGLSDHIEHLVRLGVNAVYLGPVFESAEHGYDTIDYRAIDRRLGDEETFAGVVDAFHDRGIRIVLDGVFNHVSRFHPMFQDLRIHGACSKYVEWFKGVDFSRSGPFGYGFDHRGWEGYKALPEWNLDHPGAREHVLSAAAYWTGKHGIDGWRLDVAYCLPPDFWREFRGAVVSENPEAFLIGEIDQGDFRERVAPGRLHSATNYLLYKSVLRTLMGGDPRELAALLRRAFASGHGFYRDLPFLNFLSNHDVTRVASHVPDRRLLEPAMALLFTLPGVPCLYYGDEFGETGRRVSGDGDRSLRKPMPATPEQWPDGGRRLYDYTASLIRLRRELPALTRGTFDVLDAGRNVIVYVRETDDESVIVAVHLGAESETLDIRLPDRLQGRTIRARLNESPVEPTRNGIRWKSAPPHTVWIGLADRR